jgi:hypothetical protein
MGPNFAAFGGLMRPAENLLSNRPQNGYPHALDLAEMNSGQGGRGHPCYCPICGFGPSMCVNENKAVIRIM